MKLLPNVAPRTGLKWLAALEAANALTIIMVLARYSGALYGLMIGMLVLCVATAAGLWRLATAATPARPLVAAVIALLVIRMAVGVFTALANFHADASTAVFAIVLGAVGVVYVLQCVRELTPRPESV